MLNDYRHKHDERAKMTDDKPTGTPGGEFYRADMTREAAEDIAGKGNVKPMEPTGLHQLSGLTDEQIDKAMNDSKYDELWHGFARRIEAIVRKDYEGTCADMTHKEFNDFALRTEAISRKDERERAAGICNAMTGDSDATAAIRRGEE